jgi:hypothetical protein
MNGDGPAALLEYLMTYDISHFQVRDVPNTDALAEQKVEGLKNLERWWHGILQTGAIGAIGMTSDAVSQEAWIVDWVTVLKEDLRDLYARWLRTRRFDGEEVSEAEFSRRMKIMLPEMVTSKRRGAGGSRPYVFKFPPLDLCRQSFERMIGSEIVWPDEPPMDGADEEIDFPDDLNMHDVGFNFLLN